MERKKNGERKKNWRDNLVNMFELPKEILLNLPHITIIGNRRLYLENHRGVIEYTSELIRIGVNSGEIILQGRELQIKYLFSEEIVIEGILETLEFES